MRDILERIADGIGGDTAHEVYCRLLDAKAEIERLRAFSADIMGAWPDGGIDGGDLQDIAVKNGLLITETRIKPCGVDCQCAYYGFPTTCYRRVDWLVKPNAQAVRRGAAGDESEPAQS